MNRIIIQMKLFSVKQNVKFIFRMYEWLHWMQRNYKTFRVNI